MNIFLAFLQAKTAHPIPAYSFWEYYIKNGIEEAGCQWTEADVDWAEGLAHSHNQAKLERWKTTTWEKVVATIRKQHLQKPISFFLSYFYPHQVEKEAIKKIQDLGIPCINFFCDNVREFTKVPAEFAVFDLNWVPEYKALPFYKKAKYNYIHLPMPMWVAQRYRGLPDTETTEISFIGSKDILRTMLFEEAVQYPIDLTIYGAGWTEETITTIAGSGTNKGLIKKINHQVQFINRFGLAAYIEKWKQRNYRPLMSSALQSRLSGKIDFDSYIKITKESMVTLGVSRYPSFRHSLTKPDTYSRLRDIEAPMLGACYLTEYTAGLEELYDLGSEIETYSNVEEMAQKIEKLQKDKQLRLQLRNMGQKRALSEHSIANSLAKIKLQLNIK